LGVATAQKTISLRKIKYYDGVVFVKD